MPKYDLRDIDVSKITKHRVIPATNGKPEWIYEYIPYQAAMELLWENGYEFDWEMESLGGNATSTPKIIVTLWKPDESRERKEMNQPLEGRMINQQSFANGYYRAFVRALMIWWGLGRHLLKQESSLLLNRDGVAIDDLKEAILERVAKCKRNDLNPSQLFKGEKFTRKITSNTQFGDMMDKASLEDLTKILDIVNGWEEI